MENKNPKTSIYKNYHGQNISISAENVSPINIEGLDVPLYKIDGLKITYNNSLELKKFDTDKNFIWLFDDYFFHQTIENNSQYDYIKTIISDIKPVFMDINKTDTYNPLTNSNDNKRNFLSFHQDMYEIYKVDADDQFIYDFTHYNYYFKEVYLFVPHRDFLVDILPQKNHLSGFFYYGQDRYWNNPAILAMRKRILPLLKKNTKFPEKIYISREDSAERYKEFFNKYDKINDNNKTKEIVDRAAFFKTRFYDKENIIKQFYENKGYKSVCFEKITYLEQLNYIYNAKDIATIIGSACINLFVADKTTRYREIHVNSRYDFSYDFMCSLLDIPMNRIDLTNIKDDKLILSFLEENNNNFIKYESRYFNQVLDKGKIIEKSSYHKEKIVNEYNYYFYLPEKIQKYFVCPKNLKIFTNKASYEMEKINTKNFGKTLSESKISFDSFLIVLNNIKQFKDECVDVGKTISCNPNDSYSLVIKKTLDRIKNDDSLLLFFDRLILAYNFYIKNRSTWNSVISHGDLCLSNILWVENNNYFKLIDPKGAYEKNDIYMDEYYDFAKLSHSILGGYDSIIYGNSFITEDMKNMFIEYLKEKEIDISLLRVYEASLFLSMIPLHKKNTDLFVKQCDKILIDLGF